MGEREPNYREDYMDNPQKKTLAGLEILRLLASDGYRIFTFEDAVTSAKAAGVNEKYTSEALTLLKKNNWIESLKKGVYAFTIESGLSTPPHEFEIAQALVSLSAISHWTAMHFHHLTQQTPNIIYSIAPKNVSIPRMISKDRYRFIKVGTEYFFGLEEVWIEEARVRITDVERTLLDGLRQPQYCGNFAEVLHAFKMCMAQRLDIKKIIQYAFRFEKVISKRLGYILQLLNVPLEELKLLLEIPVTGFKTLNPNGPRKGPCNKTWMIIENI